MTPSAAPVALVAGASRGLGLLVARELASRGHRVAILARDAESLSRARESAAVDGLELHPYRADVTDSAGIERTVAQIESELGPIEVSIHVAGVIQVGPLEATTREHFEQAVDIMLWGPINVALAVLPAMRERGHGRIGTVTSIGGTISVPRLLPYSVAKFGAVGFTQGLSAELAGTGVTATTIVPGLMRTGSHLQAQFTGDAASDYAWFGPSASLPLVSADGARAARTMVDAVLAGRPIVTITPAATLGMRVHGLAPATVVRALGLVSRVLPKAPPGERRTVTGEQARAELAHRSPRAARVVAALTTLGDRAARRTNELPDQSAQPGQPV